MLLTPTMLGSLIAGVACWLLFWYGISHVDSIPYLNQYVSRKMILDWIRKNPQLALIITELINIGMHGLGSSRVSAKPAMRGHFKTGHSRPGTLNVVPIAALCCKSHF